MRKPHLEKSWVKSDVGRDGVTPWRYDQWLFPGLLLDAYDEAYEQISAWARDQHFGTSAVIKIFCGKDGLWRAVFRQPFRL